MGKNQCSRVILASGILICLVFLISIPAIAAPPALISDSGQKLASVFEGLKPNPQLANYQPVMPLWRGMLQGRLPGLRNVNIVMGNFCPSSTCEGNYQVIVPLDPGSGCISFSGGCPEVNNTSTNTQDGFCKNGAMDSECGGGDLGPCCANWEECPSPSTIRCPTN